MNKKELVFLIAILLVLVNVSMVFAISNCNLDASLINQDPDPAIPGNYVEVLFQLSGIENSVCNGARFEIIPEYPFSLDNPENAKKEIFGDTFVQNSEKTWNIPYKLRIDPDALEGENEIQVRYSSGNAGKDFYVSERFNISIEDVRVDFEISVKDYDSSDNELTFEILNIGEHDIESLTIEIPEQENIQLKSSPRRIVGSLDSNEETTFDFTAIPKKGNLKLDIYYTDEINERRSLEKQVYFNPEYFKSNGKSSGVSIWFWLFLVLVIIFIGRWFWKKRKTKKKKRL
ncbi:MAG: hypothetical protein ACOCUU_02855 [Nanoarchaeota archaeon]